MNPTAVILIIVSALIHAVWNLFSKKSRNKIVFNWYLIALVPIIYFPLFMYFIFTEQLQLKGLLFIIPSGFFIASYFYTLGKAYTHGHLSLTYPVARSSVIFVPIIAMTVIKEQLSLIGILGIIIILIGVYLLHLRSFNLKSFFEPLKYMKQKGTIFAFLTALIAAFIYVIDKVGVNYVSPLLYIYLTYIFANVFYLPMIYKNSRKDIKQEWKLNKNTIIISAFSTVLSYVLILFAFQIDKVSYIVSLRQLSIVFGVIFGSLLLKEKYGKIRIIASIIMFIGFFFVTIA